HWRRVRTACIRSVLGRRRGCRGDRAPTLRLAFRRGGPPLPVDRAVAVRKCRNWLPDRNRCPFGGQDRVEPARGFGLVDNRRLVGLDFDQSLASFERIAG